MSMVTILRQAQDVTKSMVCVGLDFDVNKVPAYLKSQHGRIQDLIIEFNKAIIQATAPFACTYKPNMAFYESNGEPGLAALRKIIEFIRYNHPNHFIILDGKRGDIGNTAAHYATALKEFKPDAVTVNPYLGPGTLTPFLEAGLGIIALCVTTNPDAAVFQNVVVKSDKGERPMYVHVADTLVNHKFCEDGELCQGNVGLVAGATHPEELGQLRQLIGDDIMLLIPGIGKQEGSLEKTVRNNGQGLAVVNASRSILYASTGKDFAEAAALEAQRLCDEINKIQVSV